MKGIYRIINPKGAVYIGQSKDIDSRIARYKRLACADQEKIHRSLLKYGVENHSFIVAHELPEDVSQEVLGNYEIFYIQQYKDCGFEMLNIAPGGLYKRISKHTEEAKLKISEAGRRPCSEETKRKISEAQKGEKNHWFGKKNSQKQKQAVSLACTGRKDSEETRFKKSISQIGNKNGLGNKGTRGRKLGKYSKERIAKAATALKGKPSPHKGKKWGPYSAERIEKTASKLRGQPWSNNRRFAYISAKEKTNLNT